MSYNGDIAADYAAICDSFESAVQAPNKRWLRNADYPRACGYILDTMNDRTASKCWRVGDIFLMWQVGRPWWADQPILQEELLLAIGPKPDLRMATTFLEVLASMQGTAGVALGTSLSTRDRALTRAYQRLGYAHEASLLYKGMQ